MKLKTGFLATTALLTAGSALAADVEVYGQVNKLLMGTNNGVDTNTAVVDNDASSTRFGFKAQQQLENGLVIGALLELQSESNSSSEVSMSDDTSNEEDNNGITERHSRIGVGSKYGTFLIGKTSESTDGIAEIDLGGVTDVMGSDMSLVGGGVSFMKKSDEQALAGRTIGSTFSNMDGGRTNLVRYDSPIFNGVSSSVSLSSGGDLAVAGKYSVRIADRWDVKAGLGYKKHESSSVIQDEVSGSISAKCDVTGVAATVAMGERSHEEANREDADFLYTKLSYLPTGSNFEYAVDYSTAESVAADNEEVKAYGVGTQYNITEGVSTSVMYRQFEASKLTDEVDDIKVMTAGLKVKF